MMRNTQYNCKLGKGCGLIEETLSLLEIYQDGMTIDALLEYVHQSNTLSKCTELRTKDIVKLVFYPRLMSRNPKVPIWLKEIRSKGLLLHYFKQLLLLYCARENAVIYDYIINVLNEFRLSGVEKINADSIKNFVVNIVNSGQANWGESICVRQARYIKKVLVEFDMINNQNQILPYEIYSFTVLYLMHELHFEGLSDVAIWNHDDWKLFGLDKYQVQDKIMEFNLKGGYIAQCTGDLMTIAWKYNTMEEFINGTL